MAADRIVPREPEWWWRENVSAALDGWAGPVCVCVYGPASVHDESGLRWGYFGDPVTDDGRWLRPARPDDVPAAEAAALREERDRLRAFASAFADRLDAGVSVVTALWDALDVPRGVPIADAVAALRALAGVTP